MGEVAKRPVPFDARALLTRFTFRSKVLDLVQDRAVVKRRAISRIYDSLDAKQFADSRSEEALLKAVAEKIISLLPKEVFFRIPMLTNEPVLQP